MATERQQHTPGPWSVMIQNLRRQEGDPRLPELWQVPVAYGNVLAMVYSAVKTGEDGKLECLANANLIAAAAELLDVLEDMVFNMEQRIKGGDVLQEHEEDCLNRAKTAIAKAKAS